MQKFRRENVDNFPSNFRKSGHSIFLQSQTFRTYNVHNIPLYFWTGGRGGGVPNMGIRIFNADGQIVATVGGRAKGDACDIHSAQVAVAAGANRGKFDRKLCKLYLYKMFGFAENLIV